MNMIEKVARAIGCIDADRCQYANSSDKNKREKMGTCLECKEAAKAAIAAMREPSEVMLFAPDLSGHEAANLSNAYLVEIYQAMIDAALKEKRE